MNNKSRRQKDVDQLIRETPQLKKKWKKASDEEKVGINALQGNVKYRRTTLRRAENLRKSREKKRLFKDPYKFVNLLFTNEKGGRPETSKQDLEQNLEGQYADGKRHEQGPIPEDIAPIEQPEHQMDTSPPK